MHLEARNFRILFILHSLLRQTQHIIIYKVKIHHKLKVQNAPYKNYKNIIEHTMYIQCNMIIMPPPRGIKRWCCLTSVAYIWSAGGVCGRPAGWRVLADRARLGRPGCRCAFPLQAWAGSYRGGRTPTSCLK